MTAALLFLLGLGLGLVAWRRWFAPPRLPSRPVGESTVRYYDRQAMTRGWDGPTHHGRFARRQDVG